MRNRISIRNQPNCKWTQNEQNKYSPQKTQPTKHNSSIHGNQISLLMNVEHTRSHIKNAFIVSSPKPWFALLHCVYQQYHILMKRNERGKYKSIGRCRFTKANPRKKSQNPRPRCRVNKLIHTHFEGTQKSCTYVNVGWTEEAHHKQLVCWLHKGMSSSLLCAHNEWLLSSLRRVECEVYLSICSRSIFSTQQRPSYALRWNKI